MVLLPLLAVAAGVVLLAGVLKLRVPGERLTGLAEVALGGAALAAPGRVTAALLALAYAVFAVVAARRAAEGAGCGCFGAAEDEEPPGPLHVGLDLLAAVACGLAVPWPPRSLGWLLGQDPAVAAATLLALGASVWAAYLAFTVLPGLWRAPGAAR